ncbi:hypothetical protein [Chryseolinea soli]|uniref:Uncharacterized protein n=1 Tax=Chryseolinea soli TaxID=2321403 RepID=A0A385SJQ5_9BACT|nr:hypothetical protein [Chryseolinea soli]AYB31983.1 hypothetical protein D4L85_16050 [Chryseolinea soli]
MTREEILQTFLEDPLLIEKKHIAEEKIKDASFSQPSNNKLIEVIKLAITGNVEQEPEGVTSRKINQYLNR